MFGGGLCRDDGDERAEFEDAGEVWHLLFVELHDARNDGVDGVVFACARAHAWVDFGAALTDKNFAGQHLGAVGTLHAEAFCNGISAVCCGALCFFMCHIFIKPTQVGHSRCRLLRSSLNGHTQAISLRSSPLLATDTT